MIKFLGKRSPNVSFEQESPLEIERSSYQSGFHAFAGGGTNPDKAISINWYRREARKGQEGSLEERLERVEKQIDELEMLISGNNHEGLLSKARQLTDDICRLGAVEAMRTSVAIQLVGRLSLMTRVEHLIGELRYNLQVFKENLMLAEA